MIHNLGLHFAGDRPLCNNRTAYVINYRLLIHLFLQSFIRNSIYMHNINGVTDKVILNLFDILIAL